MPLSAPTDQMLHFVSMLVMRGIVFGLWVQVPLWWGYAFLFALHTYQPTTLPLSIEQWFAQHRYLVTLLFVYSCAENLFSLYYQFLCRLVQRPGPRPIYGRRFLRYVLGRALDSGTHPVNAQPSTTPKELVVSSTPPATRHRIDSHALEPIEIVQPPSSSAKSNSGRRTPPLPNGVGGEAEERESCFRRLRRVSYVPAFVDDRLTETDPRAVSFAQGQSMWYWSPPPNNLTRRDVEHWLAWALYGVSLSDIEAEAQDPKAPQRLSFASPAPPSWSEPQGRRPGLIDVLPGAYTRDGQHVETRARPGEWNDPIQGNRLDFLHWCRELIEARQGFTLPLSLPHRDPKWLMTEPQTGETMHRVMRLTIDPVRTSARPLAWYLLINSLRWLETYRLQYQGFSLERVGRMNFLMYRPKDWTPEKAAHDQTSATRPLVFFHGLGIGLTQYDTVMQLFLHDPQFAQRPILVPIQEQISMAIFSADYLNPMTHHETNSTLHTIFAQEGWLDPRIGIEVLGHSWGTIVASWTIKSMNTLVKRACLVDPVCFQLWVPHVCFNFVYRRVYDAITLMMRYIVAREVGTANVLCRHFDWSSNILWPEEIPGVDQPNRVLIMFATNDAILDWKSNYEYLRANGIQDLDPKIATQGAQGAGVGGLYVAQGFAHGQLMLHPGVGLRLVRDFFNQKDKVE